MITAGFAPDSKFPLIFAEKGLLQVYLTGAGSDQLALSCGGAMNVVPDHAEYKGDSVDLLATALDELGYAYEKKGAGLSVLGKSVHSKLAPQGENAVTRLAQGLLKAGLFTEVNGVNLLGSVIGEDATGKSFVGDFQDEVSGSMTMNVASLSITPAETRIGLDFRYPVTLEKDELVQALTEKAATYGFVYHEHDYLAPLYVPLDSPLITTLLATYRDLTGDQTEPFVNGGATFARAMNNCVAFGAMFADTPDYVHQANEQWSLTSMYQVMEIYAETIYRMCAKK